MHHMKFFPPETDNALECYLNAQNKAYLNIFKKLNCDDFNCIVLGKDEIKELIMVLGEIERKM